MSEPAVKPKGLGVIGGAKPHPSSAVLRQTNRSKLKRLSIDMTTPDIKAFGDEARGHNMKMRRYFYHLWDAYTGKNRSAGVKDLID